MFWKGEPALRTRCVHAVHNLSRVIPKYNNDHHCMHFVFWCFEGIAPYPMIIFQMFSAGSPSFGVQITAMCMC